MKTCDEMVNSLLERREKYNAEQKRKKKFLVHAAVSLGCVCACALVGFGFLIGRPIEQRPPQSESNTSQHAEATVTYQEQPSEMEGTTANYAANSNDDTQKRLFEINEVTGMQQCCPMDLSPYNKEMLSLEKVTEYLDVNIPQAVSKCAEKAGLVYFRDSEFDVYTLDDGKIVWDMMGFWFQSDDGARLDILTSKLGKPSDCIYYSSTNKPTVIRIDETGENVSLYVFLLRKGMFNEENESYIIDFVHGGIYYRIRSSNVELIYLDRIVRSIVTQSLANISAASDIQQNNTD